MLTVLVWPRCTSSEAVGRGDSPGTVYLVSNAKEALPQESAWPPWSKPPTARAWQSLTLSLDTRERPGIPGQSGGTTLKIDPMQTQILIYVHYWDASGTAFLRSRPNLTSDAYATLGIEAKDRFGIYSKSLQAQPAGKSIEAKIGSRVHEDCWRKWKGRKELRP